MNIKCGPHIAHVTRAQAVPAGVGLISVTMVNLQTQEAGTFWLEPEEATRLRDNLSLALGG